MLSLLQNKPSRVIRRVSYHADGIYFAIMTIEMSLFVVLLITQLEIVCLLTRNIALYFSEMCTDTLALLVLGLCL